MSVYDSYFWERIKKPRGLNTLLFTGLMKNICNLNPANLHFLKITAPVSIHRFSCVLHLSMPSNKGHEEKPPPAVQKFQAYKRCIEIKNRSRGSNTTTNLHHLLKRDKGSYGKTNLWVDETVDFLSLEENTQTASWLLVKAYEALRYSILDTAYPSRVVKLWYCRTSNI